MDLASKEVFLAGVMTAERTEALPEMDDDFGVASLVLPKIIADSTNVAIMARVTGWLSERRRA